LKNEDDDIIFKQSNDNSMLIQIETDNDLDIYLNGARFNNKDVVTKWRKIEMPGGYHIYDIFICNSDFYSRNKEYYVENIKWEDHPLLNGAENLHFLLGDWKMVKFSDDVTATLNINHKNEVEFWDRLKTDEPIFFEITDVLYFQFLLLDSLGQ
jgi:hypothetical protein